LFITICLNFRSISFFRITERTEQNSQGSGKSGKFHLAIAPFKLLKGNSRKVYPS